MHSFGLPQTLWEGSILLAQAVFRPAEV